MTWTLASGTITQSGTDTSLAGLAGLAGVTVDQIGAAPLVRTIYNVGTLKLAITGTLTHTPEIETIAFESASPDPRLTVDLSGTYNLGAATVINGATRYSQGDAIIFTSAQGFNEAADFDIKGTFNWRGGTIFSNAWWLLDAASSVNIFAGRLVTLTTASTRLRQKSNDLNVYGIEVDGAMRFDVFLTPQNFVGVDATYTSSGAFQAISSQAGGSDALFSLSDFNAKGINYIGDAFGGRKVIFSNMAYTGDFNVTHNATYLTGSATELRKDVTLTAKLDGSPLSGAIYYTRDTNNGSRKATLAQWRGHASVDYTPDRVYIGTTDVGGVATADVLTRVAHAGTSPQGVYQNNTIIDYRGTTTDNTDVFEVHLWSYETLHAAVSPELIGAGTLGVAVTTFADPNITLTQAGAVAKLAESFVVDPEAMIVTVTANATYDDLHDALKAYKSTAVQEQLEAPVIDQTIVTANGEVLTAYAGWTLIVNSGATLAQGEKFKRVVFTTVTVNGLIDGVYSNSTGTNYIAEMTVSANSSVYIGDSSTGITKLFLSDVDAGVYRAYYEPGTAPSVLAARELYGFQRYSEVLTLAPGLNTFAPVDIEDVGITESTLATVQAYTAIEGPSKFYDRTAAFRLTEQGIKLGQIVTRSGTALEIGTFSHLINKDAASVYFVTGSVITTKSTEYAGDSKYQTEIAIPPATIEANTTEVITINLEDANGNSSVNIQASGVSTFEIWKISDATDPDDYATGELLDTVGVGIYRFISANGFKMVIRDTTTNFRVVSEMEKGNYEAALFFGSAVQLAQAPQVIENGTKLDVLAVQIDEIRGAGFATGKNSLVKLRQHITNMAQS